MNIEEAYRTLDLPYGASHKQVKTAFKQMAKTCHPNAAGPDPANAARFRRIKEAQVALLSAPVPSPSSTPWVPGEDVVITIAVSLEMLLQGGSLDVPNQLEKNGLFGYRTHPVSGAVPCRECNGTGVKVISRGIMRVKGPCPNCKGKGHLESTLPTELGLEKTFRVTVPPLSHVDMVLRLLGQGHPGTGGAPPGDVLITLKAADHKRFAPSGNNLLAHAKVSFADLCLGGAITINPLGEDKEVRVKFAAGTQSGLSTED